MKDQMLTRRYVGNMETAAYIAQDFAASFSIGKYGNRFIWDVVGIDFKINGIVSLFTGAWDIVNDTFISTIVDRTRTRWGKFRPFLIWMKIPLTLFGMLYWFMPLFFPNTATTYLPKLIYYFAFSVINETAGTFLNISQTGLLSTITPNPEERVRLISQAKFFSRFLGEQIPEWTMGILIDLINSKKIRMKLSSLFIGMGSLTAILSAAMTFWFYLVSRERVMQSLEKPRIIDGLKAIINNKPLLLITLSDFLEQFRQIKNMGNLQDILAMVPGASSLKNVEVDEKAMAHTEAIILSMTEKEREHPNILNASRKKRIAKGSGTSVEEINRLLKQYEQMNKMMKQFKNMGSGKKRKMKIPFNF